VTRGFPVDMILEVDAETWRENHMEVGFAMRQDALVVLDFSTVGADFVIQGIRTTNCDAAEGVH
jgi:hypothetical protein